LAWAAVFAGSFRALRLSVFAALAFYPGLRPRGAGEFRLDHRAARDVLGGHGKEVSPTICQHVAHRAIDAGTTMIVMFYGGAVHDYDDPSEKR
jgi:hypothetical protein